MVTPLVFLISLISCGRLPPGRGIAAGGGLLPVRSARPLPPSATDPDAAPAPAARTVMAPDRWPMPALTRLALRHFR